VSFFPLHGLYFQLHRAISDSREADLLSRDKKTLRVQFDPCCVKLIFAWVVLDKHKTILVKHGAELGFWGDELGFKGAVLDLVFKTAPTRAETDIYPKGLIWQFGAESAILNLQCVLTQIATFLNWANSMSRR
jgi:hypothetical protein